MFSAHICAFLNQQTVGRAQTADKQKKLRLAQFNLFAESYKEKKLKANNPCSLIAPKAHVVEGDGDAIMGIDLDHLLL